MSKQIQNASLVGLLELGQRNDVDIQPTLLRVMTDLYTQKPMHSADEEHHFTELALRLIDVVDANTRAIVKDRLASYPAAPLAVRRRLSRERALPAGAPETAHTAAPQTTGASMVAAELNELFLSANADERRLILLNLPYAQLRIATPIPQAIAREATRRLETAALAHQVDPFALDLGCTLAIPHPLARRLVDDASGEPIVVAAVVLAMPPQVLQRILLCLNPHVSQSVQRVYDLAALYEEIALDAALRLLAIWQASGQTTTSAPPTHQPQYQPTGDSPRVATMTPRQAIRWDEHAKSQGADSA
jgi:hypothetical protein